MSRRIFSSQFYSRQHKEIINQRRGGRSLHRFQDLEAGKEKLKWLHVEDGGGVGACGVRSKGPPDMMSALEGEEFMEKGHRHSKGGCVNFIV